MGTFHLKVFCLFAIWVEFDVRFSKRPCLAVHYYKDEMILDIPFCQIVLTPYRSIKGQTGKIADDYRDTMFSSSSKGVTEN